jgi:hypothetical protein
MFSRRNYTAHGEAAWDPRRIHLRQAVFPVMGRWSGGLGKVTYFFTPTTGFRGPPVAEGGNGR